MSNCKTGKDYKVQNNYQCDSIEEELHHIKEAIKKLGCIIKCKDFTCDCTCECNCTCECSGGGGGTSALCIAQSDCATGESTASVAIPPNACITKIYASLLQNATANNYATLTITPNAEGAEPFFCHIILQNSAFGAEFDTTLVQPLCVGSAGATATITAAAQQAEAVTITVVYCLDCCAPTPPPLV